MKNRYPKACSVCQGTVPAGQGTLRKAGPTWTVTHAEVCPRDSVRHGCAKAYMRRVLAPLNHPRRAPEEITESVHSLAELVRTGWAKRDTCEKVILSAKAFANMDRLEVEEIIQRFLPEGSRC